MATGTVVRFDRLKGFGFITPDDGGEDLFLHASAFAGEVPDLPSGTRVRFQPVTGDRGVKAVAVEVVGAVGGAPAAMPKPVRARGDDEMCDVLTPSEYAQEVTEVLIEELPSITGAQIARIRGRLAALATGHGWIEED